MIEKLVLFETTHFCKGAKRGIAIDEQRRKILYVPNSFIDFVNQYNGREIDILNFSNKNRKIIRHYLKFIRKNELGGLFSKELAPKFKVNKFDIDLPSLLQRLIFEFDQLNSIELEKFQLIVNTYKVFYAVILLEVVSMSGLERFKHILEINRLSYVELVLMKQPSEMCLNFLIYNFPKIRKIFIYAALKDKSEIKNIKELHSYRKSFISFKSTKNELHRPLFSINGRSIIMSKNANVYLNSMLYFRKSGQVLFSPNSEFIIRKVDFSKLTSSVLYRIIQSSIVKRIWSLSKDNILVCRTCEYRYICLDNRVPMKGRNGYYYESTCLYNK